MKIKHKISLWFSCSGILVGLLFSIYIFVEMREMAFSAYDTLLLRSGKQMIRQITENGLDAFKKYPLHPALTPIEDENHSEPFWIVLRTPEGNILYESLQNKTTPLPPSETGGDMVALNPKDGSTLHLWVHSQEFIYEGSMYILTLGYPIANAKGEAIAQEEQEIFFIVLTGFFIITILFILLSYWVAGQVVRPLGNINRLASEIDEGTLDKRLPVRKNNDELDELSQTLNSMFNRLHHSFSRQKRYIADAAHELKTPITIVRLFLEESQQRTDLPEDYFIQMQNQIQTLRRASRLAQDILGLSFLEFGQLQRERLCFNSLCEKVIDDFKELLSHKDITLRFNNFPCRPYMGNNDHLTRVVINIVDNAIKYNIPSGSITISVFEQNNAIFLSVHNTGPGIPDGELENVFEQFYRVEKSHSHKYGGTGLGLTIVKQIVELHGGSISIESSLDEWCKVNIILPHTRS